ncbi:Tigger transposable element-derived protein 6, partial [Dictyocoela muelleri]
MTKRTSEESNKKMTLKEKLEIIEYKKSFKSTTDTRIAEIFTQKFGKNVCRRSIKDFMKKEEQIKNAFILNGSLTTIPRNIKYDKVDKALKLWIDMIENQGGFITEEILKSKAKDFFKNANAEKECNEFKASNGWLYRFKKRHNISLKQCSGESFSVQNQNYDGFINLLKEKIAEYGEKNVFNCDETALFYKLAPSKSLLCRVRNGIKRYKDRITIMLACNMEGSEKIKPFVIGKFRNPRAFKNFDKDFFCRYTHNKNAWMTSAEFNTWLFDWNSELRSKNRKILLVLDNCPGHKITCETSHIELLFLPKNSTSKLQPLDAGIIRSFKAKFYSYQLSFIVGKITKDVSVEKLFKEFLVKDAIIYAKYAWDDVSSDTIKHCWQKVVEITAFSIENPSLAFNEDSQEEKIINFEEVTQNLCVGDLAEESEYLDFRPDFFDIDIPECKFFKEIGEFKDENGKLEDENDFNSTDTEPETHNISYSNVISSLKTLKDYFLKDGNIDQIVYESLKSIETKIYLKRNSELKTLHDYFKKK